MTLEVSITTIGSSILKMSTKMKKTKILSEYELVSHLAENLTHEFQTDAFAREFAVGYGIADLVFAKSFYSRKNKLDRRPISNYYSLVLYLAIQQKQSFTIPEARQILQSSQSITQSAIAALLEDGYIRQAAKGTYVQTINVEHTQYKLVAIEAKLRDWKQGILQARRYKTFTDESYLAILSKYEKNIDPELLEHHDIGLILVDEDCGSIDFKRRPEGHRPKHMQDSVETELFANEIFLNSFCVKTA